ncbi:VOC family protein [Clostridium paridis]|uniref:VOC family protein n=1 Tax=Clostridium paridis TaxID=2803863 RepID=A0A937FAI7_9CLOT|nr:VOC family protein [Clostridium paridis]MBL4930560.1 VOC family protein [Clostridium paridis]
MKIHHIGYLVASVEESIAEFEKLGYISVSNTIYDEAREINICFVKNMDTVIELVSPVGKSSVVYNLYKKMKSSPYHICYESNNLKQDINKLCSEGYTVISNLSPAVAIENRNVVFLYNNKLGLIELVENS